MSLSPLPPKAFRAEPSNGGPLEPPAGERNPMLDQTVEAQWPADPLAGRRDDIEAGARLVRAALADGRP